MCHTVDPVAVAAITVAVAVAAIAAADLSSSLGSCARSCAGGPSGVWRRRHPHHHRRLLREGVHFQVDLRVPVASAIPYRGGQRLEEVDRALRRRRRRPSVHGADRVPDTCRAAQRVVSFQVGRERLQRIRRRRRRGASEVTGEFVHALRRAEDRV